MPALWAGAIWVFVAHLGGGAQWTLSTYALQRIVPDRLRGRIFAFDYGLVTLAIAMSLAITGWAADHFDIHRVMLVLAAVSVGWSVAWTALTTRIRRSRSFEEGATFPPLGAEGAAPPRGEAQPPVSP